MAKGPNVGTANLDKHAETERELQRGDRRYWSPVEGKNQIRIMPPPADHEAVYARAGFHYSIGPDDKMFPCPKIGGDRKSCYLCDESDRLSKSKDEDDQLDAKELRATRRFLITVVDLTKPKEGFKVWPAGIKVFREILYYFSDQDYGDVSSIADGYDFTVTRKGSGLNTEYIIRCAKKPSNFLEEYSEFFDDDAFDDLPILEEFLTYDSDAEMEATLNGVSTGSSGRKKAKGEKDEDDPEEEDAKPRRGRGPSFPDEDDDKSKKSKKDKDDPEEEAAPSRRSSGRSERTSSRLRSGLRS